MMPLRAATSAGYTRLRPVLMTAGAMILGMVPMALGIGEGGEQNAPFGQAVIGGLLFATLATLIFVPTMYRLLRRQTATVNHSVAKVAPMPPHDPNQDPPRSAVSRRSVAQRARRRVDRVLAPDTGDARNAAWPSRRRFWCWAFVVVLVLRFFHAHAVADAGEAAIFGSAAGRCGHRAAGDRRARSGACRARPRLGTKPPSTLASTAMWPTG